MTSHPCLGGKEAQAGDLYGNVQFSKGTVVPPCPYRVADWSQHVFGASHCNTSVRSDVAWGYEINGDFHPPAAPGYGGEPIQIAWSMYGSFQ